MFFIGGQSALESLWPSEEAFSSVNLSFWPSLEEVQGAGGEQNAAGGAAALVLIL